MKPYHLLFIFLIFSVQTQCSSTKNISTVLLNGSWDFKYVPGGLLSDEDNDFYKKKFDGKDWGKIDVPSNWELQGKAEPNYAGKLKEGIGLYRTTFTIPDEFKGNRIFLRFDGVLYAYEFFVNGEFAGKWASAFNSKEFDITPYIKNKGSNTLAVKVRTHAERDTHQFDISDSWSLSGIFRDVALLSVPNVHMQDFEFKTELLPNNSARLNIISNVHSFEKKPGKTFSVKGILSDPDGKEVYSFTNTFDLSQQGAGSFNEKIILENPKLWTAETPYLYSLKLTLLEGDKSIHSVSNNVGIREIKIENGIFLLNNVPIKLKGVCMHEIQPERGRALTDEDRKIDLTLAKNANINFIRTSHYPQNQRFFEMCDSMGFYVMCEVPISYGPSGYARNLDYLPDLITRVDATVSKQINHPSIIIWSVGNENYLAEVYEKAAEYVAKKDPSRPRCFPQAPTAFARQWKETPEIFNVLAPHYLSAEELENLSRESTRPIIMSEFAHSLGNSIDNLEDNWEVVLNHKNIAGAAIWMWSDQGIKRKGNIQEFATKENHDEIWIDSTTYYDGNYVYGNDGIVYANRYPQVDFWLVRKVYSPIWVKNKKITTSSGKQKLRIKLENRFDFIDLNNFNCEWTLKHYQQKLDLGIVPLSIQAKSSAFIEISVNIPAKEPAGFILTLRVIDSSGNVKYETNIQILTELASVNYAEITGSERGGSMEVISNEQNHDMVISNESFLFQVDETGRIFLMDKNTKDTLLYSLPVLRVGRKPTLKLMEQGRRYKSTFYWDPYLISNPILISKKLNQTDDGYEISATYNWNRQEKENEYIDGSVTFKLSANKTITCDYDLIPYNATGFFMEFGLGFYLPEHFSTFRWFGEGPYLSAPGKTLYNERDIWTLGKDDFRFMGNRAKTDVAAFYQNESLGLGFIGYNSNFGVEEINDQIVFTNNNFISSFGTKVHFPRLYVEADSLKNVKGTFNIVKIDKTSEIINRIFLPLSEVKIERPFLKTYGF